MPYWRLHYHLVWRTFRRLPLLTDDCFAVVRRSIYSRARRLGAVVHDVGGTDDHVHVVVSIPPTVAVATCVGQLKGASSHSANEWLAARSRFRWGERYGALTVGDQALETVIAYVQNQREHHSRKTLSSVLEHSEADDAGGS